MRRGFKTYTCDKLSEELSWYDETGEFPLLSTQEIVNWIKDKHSNISLHAHTCTYRKFMSYISHAPDAILTFFVKDNHCHPITNPELKKIAASSNKKGSVNLFQHMSEIKWTISSIIILPTLANNGQLDSIIDHMGNMYVENNDYETRKSICDQLKKTYNVHDFQWANQGYTSLANSLFKIMNGYIPESSYNNKTREILDRFYPRALQWCSLGDIPKGLVNIDLCKQFPSILINNTVNIPVYTMHEEFEQFKGNKSELKQNGEFYIDKFTIKKFGQDIPTENGVYHVSLIKYIVDKFDMPLSNIRYKLITRHEIKSDAFKEFMFYLFNNFPEAQAKKMANSFIGDLGANTIRRIMGLRAQNY